MLRNLNLGLVLFFLTSACAQQGTFIHSPLSDRQIRAALVHQHKNWRGVKYRMGGTNRNGVDCSGFIYRTFQDRLGNKVPRSTELQSLMGHEIARNELKAGDLVFFKTGSIFKSRHVGIYMGRGEFLHASTSKGVIRSRLNNPYWKDAFWQARRIIKKPHF